MQVRENLIGTFSYIHTLHTPNNVTNPLCNTLASTFLLTCYYGDKSHNELVNMCSTVYVTIREQWYENCVNVMNLENTSITYHKVVNAFVLASAKTECSNVKNRHLVSRFMVTLWSFSKNVCFVFAELQTNTKRHKLMSNFSGAMRRMVYLRKHFVWI